MRILLETENEVLVYKPAGMACEKRVDKKGDTLIALLSKKLSTPVYLPHRLDAVTCGLVLTARSKEAVAYHNRQIAERNWHKYYIARVKWQSDLDQDRFPGPHKAYLKRKGNRSTVVRSGGQPSFLEILAIEKVPGADNERYVLIKLLTGRYHQIRIMFHNLGIPLCGDPLYGDGKGGTSPFYLEHAALGYVPMGAEELTFAVTPQDQLSESVGDRLYERLLRETNHSPFFSR